MSTSSTIKGLFILTTISATSLICPLPYQANPLANMSIIGNYQEIKELSKKPTIKVIKMKNK